MRLEIFGLGIIVMMAILSIVAIGLMIYYRDELTSAMQYEELGDGVMEDGMKDSTYDRYYLTNTDADIVHTHTYTQDIEHTYSHDAYDFTKDTTTEDYSTDYFDYTIYYS